MQWNPWSWCFTPHSTCIPWWQWVYQLNNACTTKRLEKCQRNGSKSLMRRPLPCNPVLKGSADQQSSSRYCSTTGTHPKGCVTDWQVKDKSVTQSELHFELLVICNRDSTLKKNFAMVIIYGDKCHWLLSVVFMLRLIGVNMSITVKIFSSSFSDLSVVPKNVTVTCSIFQFIWDIHYLDWL